MNVSPTDFDGDGCLDVLIVTGTDEADSTATSYVYWGNMKSLGTVKPVYNGLVYSSHPVNYGHQTTFGKLCLIFYVKLTCIKWPPVYTCNECAHPTFQTHNSIITCMYRVNIMVTKLDSD